MSTRTKRRTQPGPRSGFTLVELLASVAVLAALGSVASTILVTALDGYTDSAVRAYMHSELSIAVDRIDRELRRTARETPTGVAPEITSITATSINWNTNYSLSLSGSQLLLVESGGPPTVLLDSVASFSVQAFNESNTALGAVLNDAQCDTVRRLLVSVTLQRDGITETLRTKLYLRCTMEGA